MQPKAIQILFEYIEKKFPVDRWEMCGLHIWPIIRLDLYINLYYLETTYKPTHLTLRYKLRHAMQIATGFVKYFLAYYTDRRNNAKLTKTDALFLSDADNRILLDDKWFDRICDPFFEIFKQIKRKMIVMEKSSHKFIVPRSNPSYFLQFYLDFVLVKYLITSKRSSTLDEKLPRFEEFLEYLRKGKYDIPLPDKKRILLITTVIIAYSDYFQTILLKTKPKAGFVVSYYNPVCMGFILACKKLGISSIDIQHGVQGDYHSSYGKWTKVPHAGYELLPSEFWCWSQEDAHSINAWSKKIKQHKAFAGGNLLLTMWNNPENKYSKKYLTILQKNKSKVSILITLSPVEEHNKFILETLAPIIKKLPDTYMWWFRIHPTVVQNKRKIEKKIKSYGFKNYDVENASFTPLYALLRFTNLHITYESSSVVEATMCGIFSIVLSDNAKDLYTEQIRKKQAMFVRKNNLKKTIEKVLRNNNMHDKNSKYQMEKKKVIQYIRKKIEI